jgi:PST family polysaccharide transporter
MNLGIAISTFVLTWLLSPWRPQFFTPRSNTRPLLNFGANLAAGGFLHSLSRNTDGLLVGRFFGAAAFGLYSRGTVLVSRPLDQIFAALNPVFVPTLSRLQNQPERYRAAFLNVFEAIALISFPFTAAVLALAHPLTLVVLGPHWDKAAVIFAGFTLVAVFYPLNNVASWLFSTQGRGQEALTGFTISSTITVLSFVIGLRFGPAGVAWSYSIACLLLLLPIRFHIAGRRGPVNEKDLWIGFLRYLPLWFAVWAATSLMRSTMSDASPYLQVLICAPVGLAAGAIFVGAIASYRRRAVALLGALKDFKKFRKGN